MPESARLKDIAEPLGVSEVSVSNALSGKKGVSDKLRSLILDKARELDFDLSRYDRKKNNSPMVGVIISKRYADQNNSFYRMLYQQLILEAAKEGVLVVPEIVCDEGEQAASESARVEENQAASESARRKETDAALPHMMSAVKPDGLFLVGEMQDRYIRRLIGQVSMPVVLLDYCSPSLGCDAVMSDNYMGMYEITEYLIRRGHREIAFVGTCRSSEKMRERFCGFLKCMSDYHLPVRPEWIIDQEDRGALNSILTSPGERPTAFAFSSDAAAASTLRALKERGLGVPEDISAAGYGDDLWDRSLEAGLTRYAVDMRAMAEEAVRVMMQRIEGYNGERRVWSAVSHMEARNSVRAVF